MNWNSLHSAHVFEGCYWIFGSKRTEIRHTPASPPSSCSYAPQSSPGNTCACGWSHTWRASLSASSLPSSFPDSRTQFEFIRGVKITQILLDTEWKLYSVKTLVFLDTRRSWPPSSHWRSCSETPLYWCIRGPASWRRKWRFPPSLDSISPADLKSVD